MKRPDKHEYFMSLALLAAQRASCPRRKVGCVLVDENNFVVSTGYNGPASGTPNCTEKPCGGQNFASGMGLDACKAIHAEVNAVNQAGSRLNSVKFIYVTTLCCDDCTNMFESLLSQGKLPNLDTVFFFDGYSQTKSGEMFKRFNVIVSKLDKNLDYNGLLFKTAEMLGLRKRYEHGLICVGGALHGCRVQSNGNYLQADPSTYTPDELSGLYRFKDVMPLEMPQIKVHQYYKAAYICEGIKTYIWKYADLSDSMFGKLLYELKVNGVEF